MRPKDSLSPGVGRVCTPRLEQEQVLRIKPLSGTQFSRTLLGSSSLLALSSRRESLTAGPQSLALVPEGSEGAGLGGLVTSCSSEHASPLSACPPVFCFPAFPSAPGAVRTACQPDLTPRWPPRGPCTGGANRLPGAAQTLPEKYTHGGPGRQGGKPRRGAPPLCRPGRCGEGGVVCSPRVALRSAQEHPA